MAATSQWDKLVLLTWKNLLLQWRRKFGTIFEILFPVIFVALIFYLRGFFPNDTEIKTPQFNYKPIAIDSLDELRKTNTTRTWKLVYAPRNSIFDGVINEVTKSLELDGFVGAQSSDEMENILYNESLVAGIEFHHSATILELPKKLLYSLRFPNELRVGYGTWSTDTLFYPHIGNSEPGRGQHQNDGDEPSYSREGFSAIQNAIAQAFVRIKNSNQIWPSVFLQRLPIPEQKTSLQNAFLELTHYLIFLILLSFASIYVNAVRVIVSEKEKQLSEMMKIMGLSSTLQWASWFVRTMLSMSISITLIVVLLSLRIYTKSNGYFLWILFMVYGVSVTTFSFVVSAMFSKASWAYNTANIFWVATIAPYFIWEYESLTFSKQLLMCLSPNVAMLYAGQQITRLEILADGLQWSNLWQSGLYGENLNAGIVMAFMLFMSAVFFLLTMYIERVFPGTYGVAHPWYFPFTRAFWFGEEPQKDFLLSQSNDVARKNFEEIPRSMNLSVGIHIRQLRKVFPNGKVAVDDFSVDMYENQITVLLGQNGAGKSTTISMLTGMLQSTSGTALINGHNIRTETEKARSSFGLCPQNSILFDELTVREHILFYAKLKGLSSSGAQQEVKKYTELLNLKPAKKSKDLSGGMKRKLSLAIALCGGSKFVLCDEPSSGLDPTARRELWQVLQNEKKYRTILLTTHYMDEADILGDRIAIMADGRLECCGSSFFLKKRFGAGYHLVCVQKDECDPDDVTQLLKKYFPNISVSTDVGAELSYHLPDADTTFFEQMFQDLENNLKSLHLSSFGVSLTTLEDVFHKITNDCVTNGEANHSNTGSGGYSESINEGNGLLQGFGLVRNHWYALLKKKLCYWKRNWTLFAIMNAVVILLLGYIIYNIKSSPQERTVPSLAITLDEYSKSTTILDESSASGADDFVNKLMEQYKNEVRAQSNTAKVVITKSRDMETYFLNLSAPNPARVNREYLSGATFNKYDDDDSKIIAWFNGQPLHSAPLSLNLVHNAIVKTMIGPDYSIQLFNHPFVNISASDETDAEYSPNGFGLFSGLGLMFCFITANYIVAYIKERKSKSKLLQLMTGVNPTTYWGASWLWDLLTFVVTILAIVITVAPFQIGHWSSPGEIGLLFIVLFVFGLAALPMTYVCSSLFKSPSNGLQIQILINGVTGPLAAGLFPVFQQYAMFSKEWEYVLLVFPHYSITKIFNNIDEVVSKQNECIKKCEILDNCNAEDCSRNIFAWEAPGIGREFTGMFASAIVYFALLLLCENRVIQKCAFSIMNYFKLKYIEVPTSDEVDADVQAEKKRVNELLALTDFSSSNLILQNLTRFYGRSVAVNRLSLAIEPLECFGLLGVNGAGKTTTFKMLTGDKCISEGDAWVCGVSVKEHLASVRKMVAYCPQFDALLDDLTGRETLEMYGLLNGIRRSDITAVAESTAIRFDFIQHIDKKTVEYSGGNKRKLSTAIAFIGDPSVVYLDEPTAGMDPGTKRNIWNIISHERSEGKTIVLTTHSMDECEALCSRVAIMVQGEFKCLGSMQHLKNKFSQGYELMVKVKKASKDDSGAIEEKLNDVMVYITGKFPGAKLKETYQELLTYYVPPSDHTKWSTMFGLIESAKDTLQIEDYSIKQTSLEQVFLAMAKPKTD